MSAGLEYDFKDAEAMLKALNPKAISQSKINVLRRGANILKKNTDIRYNILKRRRSRRVAGKYKSGESVVSVDKGKGIVKVHILGDFMMKWFEIGTGERYTKGRSKKKIKRTGRIQGRYLFKQAQNLTERRIFSTIQQNMEKEIIRKANKQRKKLLKQ